ncbi:beta-lactamase family protein [Simiduia sp. 21SJ11W-1]|uniref:serine hydrolase domain-containing protein n=1 Tax=Simiduia sp. 21SJ11W-1 TaxID=2909669 RepID=UPI00209FCD26|nr:serine hydrolase [Simiduia sp. 21SJ11W-1]UTA46477.1 beta-lactamase family protein [Simiduia sp. 21SJ11W-1]
MKSFRAIAYGLLALISIGAGSVYWIGTDYLTQAPKVATSMGAKLACSARYVSGFDQALARQDLSSYSPILDELSLTFDDKTKSVSAGLLGWQSRAQFREGLGCAIEFKDHTQVAVRMPLLPKVQAPWPAGNQLTAGDEKLQALLETLVDEDNAQGLQTRALLLVHKGQLIAEAYGPGVTPETPLLGWSMAKSMTAIAIGRLIKDGKLTLEETRLFPEWAKDERASLSVKHLLTMTDGLGFNEVYEPGQDATNMLFLQPSSAGFALEKPLQHPPGQHFNYSSGTSNLLALLVKRKLDNSLQAQVDYMAEALYRPMGMQHLVFEADTGGSLVGSSYLYASGRDWARMGLLMLNEGEINGERLLDADYVRAAREPNGSLNETGYGFQFWLNNASEGLRWPDLPIDAYGAMGNRAQMVMIVPSQEAVVVRLGWTAGEYPTSRRVSQILQAVSR